MNVHLQCLRLNSFYKFQNTRPFSNFQITSSNLVPLQGNGKGLVEVLKLRGLVYTLKGQTSFMAPLPGIERI